MENNFLKLVDNKEGFSIVNLLDLRGKVEAEVLDHVKTISTVKFHSIKQLVEWINAENNFSFLKEKINRTFSAEASMRLAGNFFSVLLSDNLSNRIFITDEERLGFPNIYFRVVRAGSEEDVGSAHADRWFWDIRGHSLPEGYRRVKLWAPIVQDDTQPSLMILPGSQSQGLKFEVGYSFDGRHRPIFRDQNLIMKMVPAPVQCGQAIIFHDEMLHCGRPTSVTRVSVEFTLAIPVKP